MSTNSLWRSSRRITQQLLDIVFPPRCASCQKNGAVLCTACLATFTVMVPYTCTRCGKPLPVTGICPFCRTYQQGLSGLCAVGHFEGPLRTCILALKYEGNTRLAEPLGVVLAQTYIRWGLQADAIIPVPLHHEREQQRGYNHAQLLAEVCSTHLHIPLRSDIIVRHRATPAQVGLNAKERQQNVAEAFECTTAFRTGQLQGHTLLLLDDVYTTGATLGACARPLFAAGAKAVWGLVLARPV